MTESLPEIPEPLPESIPVSFAVPHYPTKQCEKWHCYSCNVDEMNEESYIICGECGHHYTEYGLRILYARQTKKKEESVVTSEIYYCPLCAHDF